MKATIDKFGRIVIPKQLREKFGLAPGSTVHIEEEAMQIVLRSADNDGLLVKEGGVLVFQGKAAGDVDNAIEAVRNERLDKLGAD